mmetsp:Transcript_30303/g.77797  ORF Transcript_30303/g.77797 Transcript_30303/m.77797 type:complete len:225 (-) Transcript_30303:1039-1713(-)
MLPVAALARQRLLPCIGFTPSAQLTSRCGVAMARATAYVASPPSPVSAQKSSHSSERSENCSYVKPSPSRPFGLGRLMSAALAATCISRMSKRPRNILRETMRSKKVLSRSALVPLNHATIGRKSGVASLDSPAPAAEGVAGPLPPPAPLLQPRDDATTVPYSLTMPTAALKSLLRRFVIASAENDLSMPHVSFTVTARCIPGNGLLLRGRSDVVVALMLQHAQ